MEICYLRRKFREQSTDFTVADRNLNVTGGTVAFNFNKISAEDVTLFLLKQTYKSLFHIPETINFFCRAGSDQQA